MLAFMLTAIGAAWGAIRGDFRQLLLLPIAGAFYGWIGLGARNRRRRPSRADKGPDADK